jgi:hypothetical protein
VVDATGVGAGVASFLRTRLGNRIEQFQFTAQSKSELGYNLLAAVNGGRVQVYSEPDGQSEEAHEFWWQMEHARYAVRGNALIDWFVPEKEGHDDFLMSLGLCVRAAEQMPPARKAVGKLRE